MRTVKRWVVGGVLAAGLLCPAVAGADGGGTLWVRLEKPSPGRGTASYHFVDSYTTYAYCLTVAKFRLAEAMVPARAAAIVKETGTAHIEYLCLPIVRP